MMKNATISIVAALSAILFSACNKSSLSSSGGEVRFAAESKPATKVAYSGDVVDGFERINWVNGDQIVIWSDKARTWERNGSGNPSAIYNIVQSSISAEGRYSRASIEVASSQNEGGLQWGEGYHLFLGLYPAVMLDNLAVGFNSTTSLPISFTTAQRHIQSGLPEMEKFAYHFAMKETSKPSGNNKVTLSFDPYFTAFEFHITDGENAGLELKQFRLISNKDLCGRDTFTIGVDHKISHSHREIPDGNLDTNIKVVYNQAKPLSQNNAHVLTVFGGMNSDTAHEMKVELTFTGGDVRTLDLKTRENVNAPFTWIPFPRGKKAKIDLNVLSTGIKFSVTVEGQQIDYYQGSDLDSSGWYQQ